MGEPGRYVILEMEVFGTFRGNTILCSVDQARSNIVLRENFQAHALHVGEYLVNDLGMLMEKHPIIGDVRG